MLAGHLKGESLLDGSIDLAYVALINDAMDVKAENERLYEAAMKEKT